MAVASFEVSPNTTGVDTTGDVPIVLTGGITRSDPVDGASLVVVKLHRKDSAAALTSVTDDATFNPFYGAKLFSDGLNQYGSQIFSDTGSKQENRTGLITNGLGIGDTITFHYDAPIGNYRTYARAYTGVNVDRCWDAPDEITLTSLFYTSGVAENTPFTLLAGDSGDSYGISANDSAGGPVVWSQPTSTVDPTTPEAGLLIVVAKNLLTTTVFPSGVLSWDDGAFDVKDAFNDYNIGDTNRLTVSWAEKVVSASDTIDLDTTPATNPTHQFYNYSGNVLRPGPGPRPSCVESLFRPQIYRRPNN